MGYTLSRRTIPVIALLLALLVVSGFQTGGRPARSLPGSFGPPDSHASATSVLSARGPVSALSPEPQRLEPIPAANLSSASVEFTLVPANGSLFAGNRILQRLSEPQYAAYDPELGVIFVIANQGVLEIDPSTFSMVGRLVNPPNASGIVYVPETGDLLLATPGNVTLVDPRSDQILQQVHAPDAGQAVSGLFVYDPAQNVVVVSSELDSMANVVNLTLGRVVSNLTFGAGTIDGAFDPTNDRVYIADHWNDALLEVTPSTWAIDAKVKLPGGSFWAQGVAVDSVTGNVYVTGWSAGWLAEFSIVSGQFVRNVPLPGSPSGVVFDNELNVLFIADSPDSRLLVVDAENLSVIGFVKVPQPVAFLVPPWSITYVPELSMVLVPSGFEDQLSAVSTENLTVMDALSTFSEPTVMVTDPECACFVVADSDRDALYFVDESTLVVQRTVPLPGMPTALAYDSATQHIWVALGGFFGSQGLEVLNGSTGTKVGFVSASWPESLVSAPQSGRVFVVEGLNPARVAVYASSNLSLLGNISLSNTTSQLGYDPGNNRVYATDSGTDNVGVFGASNDQVFPAINVSTHTGPIRFDPVTNLLYAASTTSGTVAVIDPTNDTWVKNIATPRIESFAIDASGSTLIITGGGPNITLVNISSGGTTITSVGSETHFPLELASGNLAVSDWTGGVYILGTSSGGLLTTVALRITPALVLEGDSVSLLGTSQGGTSPLTYSYTGLPPGCSSQDLPSWNCTPNLPGTYEITLTISDSAGHRTADSATLWVVSRGTAFLVEFRESGLPNGTTWSILIGGGPWIKSSSTLIDLFLPNGTYPFASWKIVGFNASVISGAVNVSGSGETIFVTYVLITYHLWFTEGGLPPGMSWWIQFAGRFTNVTADGGTDEIGAGSAPNGTYSYSFERIAGWTSQNYTYRGNVTIAGAPKWVNVSFAAVPFNVTFSESGLPPGGNWSVTLNATSPGVVLALSGTLTKSSHAGARIGFSVSDGSFIFRATATGYETQTGTINVSGSDPPPVRVGFVPVPQDVGGGWSQIVVWSVAATLSIILAAIGGTLALRRRARRRIRIPSLGTEPMAQATAPSNPWAGPGPGVVNFVETLPRPTYPPQPRQLLTDASVRPGEGPGTPASNLPTGLRLAWRCGKCRLSNPPWSSCCSQCGEPGPTGLRP